MENRRVNNIVVVEDNLLIASEIRKNLEQAGFYISKIFESGEELLSSISKLNPDLIIMDIMLKGKLNGIDTVKQFKKTQNIPAVFLTAYSDRDTLQKAREIGPYIYLIKPAVKEELITTIELALREFYKFSFPVKCNTLNHIENLIIASNSSGNILLANSVADKLLELNPASGFMNVNDILLSHINLLDAPEFIKKENLVSVKQKFAHRVEFIDALYDWGESILTVIPIHKVNDETAGVLFSIKKKRESEKLLLLKEAEEKYSTLLNSINMPSLIIDTSGTVFYINSYFTSLFGWLKSEIKNLNWFDSILPDSTREMIRDTYNKYIEKPEKQLVIDYKLLSQSGTEKRIRWHHLPLFNKNNSLTGFLIIGENITP